MDLKQLDLELRKGYSYGYYLELAESELLLIPMLIHDFTTDHRYDDGISSVVLESVSKSSPELIYPFFDYLAKALYGKFKVYRCSALKILINTLDCDNGSKWQSIEDVYFEMLLSDNFIDFNSALYCTDKIVTGFPEMKDRIFDVLENVKDRKFYSDGECVEELTPLAASLVEMFWESKNVNKSI